MGGEGNGRDFGAQAPRISGAFCRPRGPAVYLSVLPQVSGEKPAAGIGTAAAGNTTDAAACRCDLSFCRPRFGCRQICRIYAQYPAVVAALGERAQLNL